MTLSQLLNLAVVTFKERNLQDPAEADRFFIEYGVGNTVDFAISPYERFTYYRDLLRRLRASDPQKFDSMHKGTPLYFLSWLAFDQHLFESALHFIDAAIAEDRRTGQGWFNKPASQILMLNSQVQVSPRTVDWMASQIDGELQRFEQRFGIAFPREAFLRRFAEPEVKGGTPAIVAAFYAFVFEFDDREIEIGLRIEPVLGSYQPLFIHLFKGGLLLETLLKRRFPHLASEVLGSILNSNEFKSSFGFKTGSTHGVSVSVLCADAAATTPESAFLTTGRLRSMMGHNLIGDPLPTVPDDYSRLVRQEIDAFLYAVEKLCP
jgi:hypothetical protein